MASLALQYRACRAESFLCMAPRAAWINVRRYRLPLRVGVRRFRTLVLPRTHRDAAQWPARGTAACRARLSHDADRAHAIHARNRVQRSQHRLERDEPPVDHGQRLIEKAFAKIARQKRMVGPKAADERPAQRGQLLPQRPARQVGQHDRIGRAGDQGAQHRPSARAHHVRDDARQLEAGVLQDLTQPVHLLGPIPHLLYPIPGQIPQLPDRRRRHEAGLQQPAFEQLRQPLAPARRSCARAPAWLLHVDQREREAVLQHVVDRFQYRCSPGPPASPHTPAASRATRAGPPSSCRTFRSR